MRNRPTTLPGIFRRVAIRNAILFSFFAAYLLSHELMWTLRYSS